MTLLIYLDKRQHSLQEETVFEVEHIILWGISSEDANRFLKFVSTTYSNIYLSKTYGGKMLRV